MQTICALDAMGVWTGSSRAVADTDGCPRGWIFAALPTVPVGTVAVWQGQWAFIAQSALSAPVVPIITYKADLWRRATSEEAATMSADLQDADAQLRELYLAVQYLDHGAPEFSVLHAAIAGRFGDARADELLAPSEV